MAAQLARSTAGHVIGGPFRGMLYVDRSEGSSYWPKLLGTYELELADALEEWIREGASRILVAGAGEGYYAVGLALRLPQAKVIAWEASPGARDLVRGLAERNGVAERVEIRGLCDLGELRRGLTDGGRALVVVDVEGGEAMLLDPELVPELRTARMLVETHDFLLPRVTEHVESRLASSHAIRRIEQRPRRLGDMPADIGIPPGLQGAALALLSEGRVADNRWLVCEPSAGA